jgi:hypothetical protein
MMAKRVRLVQLVSKVPKVIREKWVLLDKEVILAWKD